MNVIAHRGCAAQYPENTLIAIDRCAPHVDGIEIDVRRCGSGELVVVHDETLERVAGRALRIEELSIKEIREHTVGDTEATIPTLAEALAATPNSLRVNVELKETGLVGEVARLRKRTENELLVSSFYPEALEELREVDPHCPIAVLCAVDPDRCFAVAERVDATAVHPGLSLVRESSIVKDAHRQGYEVNVWTATDRDDVQVIETSGADGIIADRWDIYGRYSNNSQEDHP